MDQTLNLLCTVCLWSNVLDFFFLHCPRKDSDHAAETQQEKRELEMWQERLREYIQHRGGKRRYEVILAYLWLYEDAYQLISFISQRLEDMGFFSDLISSK